MSPPISKVSDFVAVSPFAICRLKIAGPLCNASGSDPDLTTAFPNSIPAIGKTIGRQLVGSFSANQDFEHLCDNLASFQIDQFFLTDSSLLEAVCDKAGKQIPPRPFGTEAGKHISEAAAFVARDAASILYATLVAAGAVSDGELNIMCAHAPEHIDNLNAENLNGTLVESQLCSFKEVLEVDEVQGKVLSWTSRLFITVLENIGRGDGWLGWLCEHLDIEGMNSVGLVGRGSQKQVCDDAKNGLPVKVAIPVGIS